MPRRTRRSESLVIYDGRHMKRSVLLVVALGCSCTTTPTPVPRPSPGSASTSGATTSTELSPEVSRSIAERFPGPPEGGCSAPEVCGELVRVDCGAAVDGPLHYLERKDGSIVSNCGGACFRPVGAQIEVCEKLCPPPGWTCDR
jgi:hypothetical protein